MKARGTGAILPQHITSHNALSLCSYQQNGKTLTIRQPNDRVASRCVRIFFGDPMAVPAAFPSACESGADTSWLPGADSFCARRRFDSFLRHRYPIPNSIGLAL